MLNPNLPSPQWRTMKQKRAQVGECREGECPLPSGGGGRLEVPGGGGSSKETT